MTDLISLHFNRLCEEWISHCPLKVPTETNLAQHLGISRTTVRGVLKLFEHKRILMIAERRKKFRRPPTKKDLLNIHHDMISKAVWTESILMKKLAQGEYVPGQTLSELELSKELKVTTATIREALLKISSLKLLDKEPRQRWRVTKLTESSVISALQFRAILEAHVLKVWSELDSKHPAWQELEANIKRQEALIASNSKDDQAFADSDAEFHGCLAKATANPYLIEALNSLYLLIHLQIQAYHLDQHSALVSARHHVAMLKHLKKKNLQECLKIHQEHLQLARSRLLV